MPHPFRRRITNQTNNRTQSASHKVGFLGLPLPLIERKQFAALNKGRGGCGEQQLPIYILSGAVTPIRLSALCMTVWMASVRAIRASLSCGESALMTGNAL